MGGGGDEGTTVYCTINLGPRDKTDAPSRQQNGKKHNAGGIRAAATAGVLLRVLRDDNF